MDDDDDYTANSVVKLLFADDLASFRQLISDLTQTIAEQDLLVAFGQLIGHFGLKFANFSQFR